MLWVLMTTNRNLVGGILDPLNPTEKTIAALIAKCGIQDDNGVKQARTLIQSLTASDEWENPTSNLLATAKLQDIFQDAAGSLWSGVQAEGGMDHPNGGELGGVFSSGQPTGTLG